MFWFISIVVVRRKRASCFFLKSLSALHTMPSRGAFIVIEGLDRSGKSTQTALLHEKIVATLGPTRVKMMKFPGTSGNCVSLTPSLNTHT